MSVDLTGWLGNRQRDGAQRKHYWAACTWGRIQRKPTHVRFKRDGSLLDAQTVRIDVDSRAGETADASGVGSVRRLTILGVREHASRPDLDVQRGDRVVIDGAEYVVANVNRQIVGEVQAYCEAVS